MIDELSQNILRAGLDDWVPLDAVLSLAKRLGASSRSEAVERSIAVVRELAEHGFVVLGEVSDGGFFEWGEPVREALARLERAGRTMGENEWSFCCWLSNMSSGNAT